MTEFTRERGARSFSAFIASPDGDFAGEVYGLPLLHIGDAPNKTECSPAKKFGKYSSRCDANYVSRIFAHCRLIDTFLTNFKRLNNNNYEQVGKQSFSETLGLICSTFGGCNACSAVNSGFDYDSPVATSPKCENCELSRTRPSRRKTRFGASGLTQSIQHFLLVFMLFIAAGLGDCQISDSDRPWFGASQPMFSDQNQLFSRGVGNANHYEALSSNNGKQQAAPQNLRAVEVTDTSVRLSWAPPFSADINYPAPEHYIIHYREKHTKAPELQVVGIDSTFYVLQNLQPSTLYQASVRAVRGGVQSSDSDVVDFETRNGNAPTEVEAAAISIDTIKVAWKPPVRPSTNSQLQGYNIYFTRDSTLPLSSWQSREVRANSQQHQSSSGNSAAGSFPTSSFISDLMPRSLYTIVVEAVYYPTEREGTFSRPILVKTQIHIPPQPRDVVVERLSNTESMTNTVRVRWRMPSMSLLSADSGGVPSSVVMPQILGYDVYYNASISQNQAAQQRKQRVSAFETSAELRDLLPGTDYHVWVEAIARQGAGPPSEVQLVRTLQAPPSSAPQSVIVDAQDSYTLKVRWQPPADDKQHGTIRTYKVFYKPTSAGGIDQNQSSAATNGAVQTKTISATVRDKVVTLDNLVPWTEYTVWMTAVNDAGESPESEMISARTLESVPAAPEELSFHIINATAVQITWEEPQQRRADIRYYMVYWSQKGTSVEQEVGPVWVPGERRVTIGEWRPGREYRVQVVAFGQRGDGERSKILRIQLPSAAPPPPLLRVDFDESQLQAVVKWSGPDGYEHDIIGYRVMYGEVPPGTSSDGMISDGAGKNGNVDDSYFVRREMSKNDNHLVVQGLDRGKKYQFRVAANFAAHHRPAQQSQPSEDDGGAPVEVGERLGNMAVQELVIPEGIPDAPPTNIRYQFDQQKQLTFVWDPPQLSKRNGIISQYHVEVFELGDDIDHAHYGTTPASIIGGFGRETLKFNVTTQHPRYSVHGLRPHDKYLFRVAAATTRGKGPFSGNIFVEMPLEVPRPPAGINATAVNRTAAEIWWTPVKMPVFAGSSQAIAQQQQSAAEAELMQITNAAAEPTASRLEIRGYKIYYSKTLDLANMDAWRSLQVRGADSWRVRIGDLEENATYAVIVAAETATVTGYLSEHITFRVFPELVPRDLHAVMLSKDSITLAWRPPLRGSVAYYKVTCEGKRDFLDQHGVVQAPKVPPCQPVNVTNNATQVRLEHLVPYTNYIFSLTTIPVAQPSYVPPVMLYNQTSADVPNHLLPPKLASSKYGQQQKAGDLTAFVELQLERASEKRGPVEKYWVVVVPLTANDGGEMRRPEDFTTQELVDGSDAAANSQASSSMGQPKLVPYVAASFSGESLPNHFVLGDNERYDTFQNHRLIAAVPGVDEGKAGSTKKEPQKYRTFLRAFVRKQQNDHSVAGRSDLIFKSSDYSDIFIPSTVTGGGAAGLTPSSRSANIGDGSLLSVMDSEKVPSWIWVAIAFGAIIAVILCGALVIMFVTKRRRATSRKQHQQINGGTATKSISGYQNGKASRPLTAGAQTRMPPNGASSSSPHVHYQAVATNGGGDDTLQNQNGSFGFNNNTTNSVTVTMSGGTPTPITMVNSNNNSFETQPFLPPYGTLSRQQHGAVVGMDMYDGTLVNGSAVANAQLAIPNGAGVISDEYNAEFDADSDNDDNLTTSSHRSSSILMQHQLHLQQQQRDPVEEKRALQPTLQLEKHPPISVGGDSGAQQLAMHVAELKANDNFLFSTEFESIETSKQFTWHNSLLEMNKTKNRYANVVAYDHSRVILKSLDGIPCSDYINANYCDGYRRYNAYIATQGPLPETFGDFWRMVWEQDSHIIVMLTRLEERGRLKCDEYWPSRTTETYGLMHVSPLEHQEMAFYTLRSFSIQPVGHPGEPRQVRQIQFTAWPDHGVPDSTTPFLAFVQRVRSLQAAVDSSVAHAHGGSINGANVTGPMIVHCSAGVGRSGAYIVVDSMLQRLRAPPATHLNAASSSNLSKSVDIYGHVACLREQRNFMVQTEDQYVFIYDAVLEAVLSGLTPTDIPVAKFYKRVQQKLLKVTPSGYSLADVQFERLNQFCGRSSGSNDAATKFNSATLPCNKYKNRLVNILPHDGTRACLQPIPGVDGSDYINASYIDGYRLRNAYIATQAPLKTTVDDFWRLIWEHNSTIIVMLTKCREMGVEKSEQYWPSENSARYLSFVVYPVAEYSMLQYVLREFRITDSRDGQSRTIRQFQYTEWPEQGVPALADPFIDFIGQVHKTKEQFGQDGPITVHCSTGVGRTGVFIGLSIILERLQYENAVDVFTTVKLMRAQRMQMVQTEEQYKFLYTAVLNYLSSFEGQVT